MTSHNPAALLALALALATAFATAQDCPRVVSVLPYGPPDVVTVDGSTAFLGIGRGVWVVDQSDPTAPRSLARVPMPARVRAIAAASHKAYSALGEDGIRVLDVTDPAAPVEVATVDVPGTAQGLAVGLGYLYVAAGEAGLCAVERSSPPLLVGCVDTLDARDVAVEGNHAYVADGAGGLVVVDVTLPFAMRVVGSAPMNAEAVEAASGIAYVACGADGLRTVDVREPTAPLVLGYLATRTERLALAGNLLLMPGNRRLLVVDVSHAALPVAVGSVEFQWRPWVWDVNAHGSLAAVATSGGLELVRIPSPTSPSVVGRLVTSAAVDVEVDGSLAGVGLGWDRDNLGAISLVDMSQGGQPREAASVDSVRGQVAAFALSEGRLYVAENGTRQPHDDCALRVIGVSHPDQPVELGTAPLAGRNWQVSDVAVEGSFAYVVEYESLRVVDVSDPWNPVEVAVVPLDWRDAGSECIEVVGARAFVGGFRSGSYGGTTRVKVFEVSDPVDPVPLSEMDGEAGLELKASQGLLYYLAGSASNQSGFWLGAGVVDISRPGSYEWLAFGWLWDGMDGYDADIDVVGQVVFVSLNTDGPFSNPLSDLRILDLKQPDWYAEGVPTLAFPDVGGLATAGDLLLVTDRELGLLVLDPSCVAACYGHDPRVGPCPVEQAR